MKLLHGADFHLGLTRYGTDTASGNTRVDDFIGTLGRFVDVALEEKVDLAILAGDTFESRHPRPREQAALSAAVRRLRGNVPLVIVPGNHDGMATIGAPETHTLNWLGNLDLEGASVYTVPGIYGAGGIMVHAMPYPHKRSLDEELRDVPPEQRVEEASRRVEALILEMVAQRTAEPTIFVGHLSVAGSQLGSERQMHFGWDVTVRREVFDAYDYAALGHIHRQQRVSAKAWYAGAPEFIRFDEMGNPKGFLLAEINPGQDPVVTVVPSHPRPLGVLELTQAPDGTIEGLGVPGWYSAGPIIHARLHATARRPTAGDTAELRRQLLALGATYVTTETLDERFPIEQPPQELASIDPADEAAPSPSRPPAVVPPAITTASPQDAMRTWVMALGYPLTHPAVALGDELIAAATGGDHQ